VCVLIGLTRLNSLLSAHDDRCVWGMKVNDGELLDLPSYAVEQEMSGVELGCKMKPLACSHVPCLNSAPCVDRWTGYQCMCAETPYIGKTCELREIYIYIYSL